MNRKTLNNVVAKAIRMEHNPTNDRVFLVFEIIDENFKKRIKQDWVQDIDLKLIDKNLVLDEEE